LLGRVFAEQFELTEKREVLLRSKQELDSERVQNPHDPDATYAAKGQGEQKKEHVGYKVQVAETVKETPLARGEPTNNFIVGLVTQAARESDEEGALKMAVEQKALGLEKPSVEYVDAAYISTQKLVEAAAEGRELIGPAPASSHNNDGRFTSEDFHVTVETRTALCPGGHENSQCSSLEEKATGRVSYRFEWKTAVCLACSLREQCIKAGHNHRTLVVGAHHTVLQHRRQEQKTEAFKKRMRHRNAIEGTQSELVRAHGLRQARYRGLRKAKLQNYFIGAACNIKRWLRRLIWELEQSAAAANLNPKLATA
jgi:transposase